MKWVSKAGPKLTLQELYSLLQLRIEVFNLEQNWVYQELDGQDLQDSTYHIMCFEDNGNLIAYARVMYEGEGENEVRIGRVVVSKSSRSLGLGKETVKQSLKSIHQNQPTFPRKTAVLYGLTHLRNFYESLGFVLEGEEVLKQGVPHIYMKAQLE